MKIFKHCERIITEKEQSIVSSQIFKDDRGESNFEKVRTESKGNHELNLWRIIIERATNFMFKSFQRWQRKNITLKNCELSRKETMILMFENFQTLWKNNHWERTINCIFANFQGWQRRNKTSKKRELSGEKMGFQCLNVFKDYERITKLWRNARLAD